MSFLTHSDKDMLFRMTAVYHFYFSLKSCVTHPASSFESTLLTLPLSSFPTSTLSFQTQLTAVGRHVAPPWHQAVLVGNWAARGQGHGLDVVVEGGGAAQFDQHDVVVQVVAVVLGVLDQLGRVNPLLGALVHSDVVLTKTDLDTTGGRVKVCFIQTDLHMLYLLYLIKVRPLTVVFSLLMKSFFQNTIFL